MGDRTGANIRVRRGTPLPICEAVVEIFARYVDGVLVSAEQDLHEGRTLGGGDFPLGSLEEIEHELTELMIAPTGEDEDGEPLGLFAFEFWEDPKYEYDGDLLRWVPGMARFRAACTAEGEVILNNEWLLQQAEEAPDLDTLRATLRQALGQAHTAALNTPWPETGEQLQLDTQGTSDETPTEG